VRLASGFGTDDPRPELGTGIADSGAEGRPDLGSVHAVDGHHAGVPRDSGRGTPWTMSGSGWVASERNAYSGGVKAAEAYREP
jgi:hypothetical protein